MTARKSFQTGAWVETPGPGVRIVIRNDLPVPSPSSGEVLIKLECTGVCHSDVYSILGRTPMTAHIVGHEGIGKIISTGSGVASDVLNKRVGVKWLYNYCGSCEICAKDVTYCPNQENPGRNVAGTFQQYIVSPIKPLTFIPDAISSELAAPLLCAGVTIYSAIAKLRLKPGEWLLLPGAGGGLGHLGVQIAHIFGLKVIAVDTGEDKRKLCVDLGATCFLDFKASDVVASVKEMTNGYGVHGAVCLASSKAGYTQALSLLRNLGTLVCIGLATEALPITPFEMVIRGINILGSSVGTEQEMDELLKMAAEGKVKALVEVFDFNRLDEVLQKLETNEISGRAVVMLPDS
ncbi:putative zinc-binding dehydrogenase family oxidoreductase [Halenospora varia]|nr:putative zinc-binding dehydrogenase family oxidoreductase [Halenospora varia]